MALKAEADKVKARKELTEAQRSALHDQMREREGLKQEVGIPVVISVRTSRL